MMPPQWPIIAQFCLCLLLQHFLFFIFFSLYQVVIAQWLAWGLATGEVLGSNPGKGESIYRKYYSQGIVVFLVSNGHVDSKLFYFILFIIFLMLSSFSGLYYSLHITMSVQ